MLQFSSRPLFDAVPPVAADMLLAVLDHVGFGMAVVDADTCQLLYANALAHQVLRPSGQSKSGLQLVEGSVCVKQPADIEQLALALTRTKEHQRSLLTLKDSANDSGSGINTTVAVMPLFAFASLAFQGRKHGTSMACSYALLVFAKPQACDRDGISLFASERGLTPAEEQVLLHLCRGLRPSEIAEQHGVQVSTVRSQVRSIRHKTASDSIRDVVEKVSALPPLARHGSYASEKVDLFHMAMGYGVFSKRPLVTTHIA